ncbi:MAG TPA: ROK family protein [Candidatus Eisenbergiella merdigallinarum]|uniref:ROK family protein n=1 Tax=Candidatus Eisenbergiella merdigallinarum TaxID=2838552 RepID=A0A9D2MSP5_9FIRM|nr:ROK family protein [Candidatus Eisenbergiella merdigallinarum]
MRAMVCTDMKRNNRKMIFDIVRKERCVTRAELSRTTGMSGPSIMTIVNEFIDLGILTASEKEAKSGELGRKPVPMLFNPDALQSVGIEFEGNNLFVGLVNMDGEIRYQTMVKVQPNLGDAFYQSLFSCLDKLEGMMTETEKKNYLGIGFGIPGVVDPKEKRVEFAPYVGIREPADISADLNRVSDRYGKPVLIENDVNAGAAGEYYVRRIREEIQDLLYVSVGAGIGAGIILDGKLRHGRRNLCGEIGYTVDSADQIVERSRSGRLESLLSREALCEKFEEYRQYGLVSPDMVSYMTKLLSPVIANLANALDVDRVVVGGNLAVSAGEALLQSLDRELEHLTLARIKLQGCRTDYTGVVGSALLASNTLMDTIF